MPPPAGLYSHGPYHGLPQPPSSAKNLTAVVAGANGISGQHLISVLLQHSETWTKIYALSRSPPAPNSPSADPRVTHVPVDFLGGAEKISAALKDAEMEWGKEKEVYAFYFAYKEHSTEGLWSGQKEMWEDNGAMFENFLGALGEGIRRIILQTGAKAYGIHHGECKAPMTESDTRLDYGPWKDVPNFYYRQEDLLVKYCNSHPGVTWATTRPSNIIGSVAGNFMNEAIALYLYILVSRELNPSTPPPFPGTWEKYRSVEHQSSATLLSYLNEWCALSPTAENQHFNAANGDDPMWCRLWPSILTPFGWDKPAEFGTEEIPEKWRGEEGEAPLPAPIDPRMKSKMKMRVSIAKWAKDPEVVAAWERVRDRLGLDQKVWDGASWAFADGVLAGQFNCVMGMGKARERGWFGTVTAEDDWAQVLETATKQGLLSAKK